MSLATIAEQTTVQGITNYSKFQTLLGNRARPEPKWIADLTGVSLTAVSNFLEEMNGNLPFEETIHNTLQETGRTYYAQFPAPLELYAITRIVKPENIIESGVSSGLSSAHFLMGLEKNGRGTLHSIDYPTYSLKPKRSKSDISWSIPYGKDSGWAIPSNLRSRWRLHKGKSEDQLRGLLRKIGTLDIFCHDSPWTRRHLAFELEAVRPYLRPGSIIIADNSSWNPAAVARLAAAFSTRVIHRRSSDLIGIRVP